MKTLKKIILKIIFRKEIDKIEKKLAFYNKAYIFAADKSLKRYYLGAADSLKEVKSILED